MKNRILCIGDIHGNYKGLLQVLERSNFNNDTDQLICLGDYIDGYSESANVIQHLIELQKESDNRHIFIRGNHDEWCNEWLTTGIRNNVWVNQGGKATIDSYISTKYLISEEHRKFFIYLHNYYVDDQNRGFVHGGFRSKKGLGNENYESDYYWDRDLWTISIFRENLKMKSNEGSPVSTRMYKHNEIFIGHTSTFNYKIKHNNKIGDSNFKTDGLTKPIKACNVWNLDTGSGYATGKLTIMDVDTKEYWQSDLSKELYTNENGR